MPGECKGMPGERTVVGSNTRGMQGNAKVTYRSVNYQVNAGNAGDYQWNTREWV